MSYLGWSKEYSVYSIEDLNQALLETSKVSLGMSFSLNGIDHLIWFN